MFCFVPFQVLRIQAAAAADPGVAGRRGDDGIDAPCGLALLVGRDGLASFVSFHGTLYYTRVILTWFFTRVNMGA